MRRQLVLDDYEIPSMEIKLNGREGHSQVSTSINTQQYQNKSIKIQTIIRNSEKESCGVQANSYLIAREYNQEESPYGDKQNDNYEEKEGKLELSEQVMKKVQRFLKKITPLMQSQILENLPQYCSYGKQSQMSFKKESRIIYSLENLNQQVDTLLQISDITWNATKVTLAASYSRPSHQGACSHKSMISLWYLHKRDFKPTKPTTIITPNCIFCLSFHPKKPSILACGSYAGEVLLYDVGKKQQQLLAKTLVDDYFHRDLVTQVTWWAYRPSGKAEVDHNLVSLGTDGKILIWQTPNQALSEDSQKSKLLLKYPIKGYLMLKKKEGKVICVSGISMSQSKVNKNVFLIGSEGGSILPASLIPLCHEHNTESKVILDIQQAVKFKEKVYPFLLNIPFKTLTDIKTHLQAYCTKNKIKEVDSVAIIFNSKPQHKWLYPNPINFAHQPLAYPITSISHNNYGLFIANTCDGYSRIYCQGVKKSMQGLQEGWEWGWINGGSKIGGFIGQEWVVIDFLSQQILWKVGVGQGTLWKSNGSEVGIVCQGKKVRVLELGEKVTKEEERQREEMIKKIQDFKMQ